MLYSQFVSKGIWIDSRSRSLIQKCLIVVNNLMKHVVNGYIIFNYIAIKHVVYFVLKHSPTVYI